MYSSTFRFIGCSTEKWTKKKHLLFIEWWRMMESTHNDNQKKKSIEWCLALRLLLIWRFEQILERTIIYTRQTVNENEIRCADRRQCKLKIIGDHTIPLLTALQHQFFYVHASPDTFSLVSFLFNTLGHEFALMLINFGRLCVSYRVFASARPSRLHSTLLIAASCLLNAPIGLSYIKQKKWN